MLESYDNCARSEKRNGNMFRCHAEWPKVAAQNDVRVLRIPLSSGAAVFVSRTEAAGVADAMIEAQFSIS